MISPGIYKHYDGGLYRLLLVAKDSNNGPHEDQNVAVYVCLQPGNKHKDTMPGRISIRNEEEFEEYIIPPIAPSQTGVRRFTRIGD